MALDERWEKHEYIYLGAATKDPGELPTPGFKAFLQAASRCDSVDPKSVLVSSWLVA